VACSTWRFHHRSASSGKFNLNLITTAPAVRYRVKLQNWRDPGSSIHPAKVPDQGNYEAIEEPNHQRHGAPAPGIRRRDFMQLLFRSAAVRRRDSITTRAAACRVVYEIPLAECGVRVLRSVEDEVARLPRSLSMPIPNRPAIARSDLIRLDVLINGERVDRLSISPHATPRIHRGVELCTKMKGCGAAADVRCRDPGRDRQAA